MLNGLEVVTLLKITLIGFLGVTLFVSSFSSAEPYRGPNNTLNPSASNLAPLTPSTEYFWLPESVLSPSNCVETPDEWPSSNRPLLKNNLSDDHKVPHRQENSGCTVSTNENTKTHPTTLPNMFDESSRVVKESEVTFGGRLEFRNNKKEKSEETDQTTGAQKSNESSIELTPELEITGGEVTIEFKTK